MLTRPLTRSGSAVVVPLYGTCRMSMPAMLLNVSPAMCSELPCPSEAKLSLPGLALA